MLPNLSGMPERHVRPRQPTFKDAYLHSIGVRRAPIKHIDERFGPLTDKEFEKMGLERGDTLESVNRLIEGSGFGNTRLSVQGQLEMLKEVYKMEWEDEPVDHGRIQGALDALRHMCSEDFKQNLEAISFLAREKFFPAMVRRVFMQRINDSWRRIQEAALELVWQIMRNGTAKFDPKHADLQDKLWRHLSDEAIDRVVDANPSMAIIETILTHSGTPYGMSHERMKRLANKIAEWRRSKWYRYRAFRQSFAQAMKDHYQLKSQFNGTWLLDERLQKREGTVASYMQQAIREMYLDYGLIPLRHGFF